ncbi:MULTISPECIES: phospholipid carrier-dependent glycosyltransferase [unclassified Thermosynechococcus]|uniref:phospholipid carrier-dependent glycosyltransferase n=1 Tax=unclassified Thermosynechococcus TaxID=2622553 RepID=UPI002872AEFC|nr:MULTISPECIES: phospholipid carrier-dependent glycosyltransferase [unclassified Thermosynechococcus]WNC22200.1 phospholipid carrier-dependent glycosyltransferase [Thermosynechococcus sp. PP22]WNC32437.1 phospholipid carrier-dependent glycosyltransferase [Thermosynechococcus sp. PKX95]WNC34967.1 phospholipid carrier-dependent glycosyltransferase [Thermosynechococcus sp. PKX91]WNC37483.1 phospholipid carrier-dependent glycosyltransferase [Thermosynechococcus sp. WL11]WNC40005.1 phospholipid ca
MPLGLLLLWLFALATRFWGLTRFPTLVFDEVYFARFGRNYLAGVPFFDAHPPLGKYLIALSIWLGGGFHPWGYRWLNALMGSLIPIAVAVLAYLLTRRSPVALLSGLFVALDGLFLVESRYALINISLVLFGVVAQILWLWGLRYQGRARSLWLMAAGIAFGACGAVKWSGLGFLLGVGLFWLLQQRLPLPAEWKTTYQWWQMCLLLPVVAFVVYTLLWLPHLQFHPHQSLLDLHRQMFNFHRSVASTAHPYCSPWWSWPLLLRPMSYFFQRVQTLSETVPVIGPPLPLADTQWVYAVYALFNPPLLWLGTLATLALIPLRLTTTAGRFVLLNYAANLLPWALVSRCVFIYHSLPAALYSFMALALVWEASRDWGAWARWAGIAVLGVVVGGFLYWLPLYLGLPLTPQDFLRRMWLPSWI